MSMILEGREQASRVIHRGKRPVGIAPVVEEHLQVAPALGFVAELGLECTELVHGQHVGNGVAVSLEAAGQQRLERSCSLFLLPQRVVSSGQGVADRGPARRPVEEEVADKLARGDDALKQGQSFPGLPRASRISASRASR